MVSSVSSQNNQNQYPNCCTKTAIAATAAAAAGAIAGRVVGDKRAPYIAGKIADKLGIDAAYDKAQISKLKGSERKAANTLVKIAKLELAQDRQTVEAISKGVNIHTIEENAARTEKKVQKIMGEIMQAHSEGKIDLPALTSKIKRSEEAFEKLAAKIPEKVAAAAKRIPIVYTAGGALAAGIAVIGLHHLVAKNKDSE